MLDFALRSPRRIVAGCALVVLVLVGLPETTLHAFQEQPVVSVEQPFGDEVFERYDLAFIDTEAASKRVAESGALAIPTTRGLYELELEPRDLRSPRYRAEAVGDGGVVREVEMGPVQTFRGTVRGMPASEARFTIREDRIEGVILTDDDFLYVEPASTYGKASDPNTYIVYSGSDLKARVLGTCGTTLAEQIGETASDFEAEALEKQGTPAPFVELATEADFEYRQLLGGTRAANDEILSILNQVEGVYTKSFGVTFSVVFQNVFETRDADPYETDDASTLLGQFRNEWNFTRNNVDRDLAHLFTGKNFNSTTLGIAYVGVMCRSAGFSYGLSVRMASAPGKFILTAHEIGHNFNAAHPDQLSPPVNRCDNTIMQSFVGSGFKFCKFSKGQIETYLGVNSACLRNNRQPSAVASPDLFAGQGQQVRLYGGGADPDLETLSYEWVQTLGPNVQLTGANTASLSFTAPQVAQETILTFRLTVSDPRGGFASQNVGVRVVPEVLPGFTFTSPVEGFGVKRDAKVKIRWTVDPAFVGTATVEVSRDGGETYELIASGISATKGKKNWKAKAPKSDTVFIRLTNTVDPRIQAVSPFFAIE